MRILLLIDQNTASAAEIVAGALQDNRRATLLGLRTYGKGSVQTFFDMDDGSGLKLTTAYYMTPKNQSLEKNGISPDMHVEMFEPEVIVAGPSNPNKNQGGGPDLPGPDAPDEPDEPGFADLPEDPTQKHWPARLRGDHQFEVAYQTARSWLGSKQR